MKNQTKRDVMVSICLLMAFLLWTLATMLVDVKAVGPKQTQVGFSEINQFFHKLTGVNMTLYTITDLLGLVPIGFVAGFGVLGLFQWISRRSLFKVDYSILVLGGFYIVVMTVFLLFEVLAVNYRPVLINGKIEASYPSSTTMLVLSVMPTVIMQLNARTNNQAVRQGVFVAVATFIIFMVIGRFFSGVHWFSDIVGGILISAGLVFGYRAIVSLGGE